MTFLIYEAPSRSAKQIEELADAVRKIVGCDSRPCFPVLPFLEYGLHHLVDGLYFDVRAKSELGAREGAVDPLRRVLYVREDVYQAAAEDNGRARFTICREIGHAIMHVGTLNRAVPSRQVPIFRNPEWQANQFAASLLMPRAHVRQCKSVSQVMTIFLVSGEAAAVRAKVVGLQKN